MSGWNEEMLLGLAPSAPWQPLSAREQPRESLPAPIRGLLLGAVALAHLFAVLGLMALMEKRERVVEDAIAVDFIDEPPVTLVELPPLPNETVTIRAPKPAAPRRDHRAPKPVPPAAKPVEEAQPASDAMQVVETPARPVDKRLQLFNPDGSLRVPEDMLDKLDRQFGDKRTFSWQIPQHADDARKVFERNRALPYEGTRFDQYWRPDHDALTALLEKAVEKTTKQVKVKVPGMNGSSYMVCTVAMLALSGSCRVVTNGADWNGPQDDPNTLNPEEERECAAWYQKLVDAKTQDAWRATKKLYEASCRKPLERKPSG